MSEFVVEKRALGRIDCASRGPSSRLMLFSPSCPIHTCVLGKIVGFLLTLGLSAAAAAAAAAASSAAASSAAAAGTAASSAAAAGAAAGSAAASG